MANPSLNRLDEIDRLDAQQERLMALLRRVAKLDTGAIWIPRIYGDLAAIVEEAAMIVADLDGGTR